MYIIATCKSRLDSIVLKRELDKKGIFAEVVSTPKEANVGCGLSVKINPSNLNLVKKIVLSLRLKSFVCFFKVNLTKQGKRISII